MGKEQSKPLDHRLLSRLMDDRGYSNVSLGKELGVANTTVMHWRKGTHGPAGAEAIRLSRIFGLSVAKLYGWPETAEEELISRLCTLPKDRRVRALERFGDWLSAIESEISAELAEEEAGRRLLEAGETPPAHGARQRPLPPRAPRDEESPPRR